MSVYLFTSCDVTDREKYAPYISHALPIMMRYGGEILSADPDAVTVDGEPRNINVILKFPSAEAAMQMLEDPEYQPWKQLRLSTTSNRRSILMKGFEPPKS